MIELGLVIILIFQLLGESNWVSGFSSYSNYISALVMLLVIANSRLTFDIYKYLVVACLVFISFVVNWYEQHVGGFNATLLLILSLLFIALKGREVKYNHIYNYTLVLAVAFIVFILFSVLIIGDKGGGSLAITGPYENQNTLAMLSFSVLVLLGLVNIKSNKLSSVADFILMLLFVVVLLTLSRAGILSSMIFLLGYSWLRYRFLMLFPLLILLFSLSILLINNGHFSEYFIHRITDSSGSGRTVIWTEAAGIIFSDWCSFLFGIGVNNLFFEYGGADNLSVHNSYLNYIANYGVFALFFLLLFIFLKVRKVDAKNKVLFFSIASALMYGMFETNIFVGVNSVWLVLLYSIYFLNSDGKVKNAYSGNTI